MTNFH